MCLDTDMATSGFNLPDGCFERDLPGYNDCDPDEFTCEGCGKTFFLDCVGVDYDEDGAYPDYDGADTEYCQDCLCCKYCEGDFDDAWKGRPCSYCAAHCFHCDEESSCVHMVCPHCKQTKGKEHPYTNKDE